MPFFILTIPRVNVSFVIIFSNTMTDKISCSKKKQQTIDSWQIIFFVAIGIYLVGIIVYVVYGSGDRESWNNSNSFELNPISSGKRIDETSPFTGGEDKESHRR